MKYWKSVFLFLLIFSSQADEITAQISDTLQLEQVEVKAKPIQHNNHLLQPVDNSILELNNIRTFADILQRNSSIFIKDYGPGSLATASFRGTTANHTKVLWNGVPVNAPNNGQVDFNRLPVFFIDEAALARGAQSASMQGGFGGAVMLNNKVSFGNGIAVDVQQAIGSFSSYGTYADISWSDRKLQLRTRIFRNSSKNDFDYLNTAPIPAKVMKQEQADFIDRGLLQEVHWQTGKGLFSFLSWNQWNDRNLPPIMTNLERGGKPVEKQDDRFHRNMLSYKYFWPKASLTFKSAYFAEFQHYFLQTTSNYGSYETVSRIDSENNISYWQQEINFRQELSPGWTIEAGNIISRQTAFSTHYENKQQRDQMLLKLKLEYHNDKNQLFTIGAHQDNLDGTFMIFSPFAKYSAPFPVIDNLSYTLGMSRNFHAPSLNDLYWYPGGNPNLQAEKAVQADFLLNYVIEEKPVNLSIAGGVYVSEIQDWIQWRPTAHRYWVPENISKVYARGAELFIKSDFAFGKVQNSINFNYTYSRTTDESTLARIENTQGRQLIYIPLHHANLVYKLQFKNWQLVYTIVYTGKRNTSLNEQEFYGFALPAYALHHFSINKAWKSFSISFQINNLLDKDYQAIRWRAMPGRNFSFALRYQVNKK